MDTFLDLTVSSSFLGRGQKPLQRYFGTFALHCSHSTVKVKNEKFTVQYGEEFLKPGLSETSS